MTMPLLFGATVIVPDVVAPAHAAELRARFEVGYTRYALLDRGSYDVLHDPAEPELLATLARIASEATGRLLGPAESRVVRLVPGDYLLAHHDRVHDDEPVEVMLDLSPAAVPGAEVHYRRRGQAFVRFPTTPNALTIVERGPTVTCNHTYVSKRHAGAVVRLIALLRPPTT